MNIEEDLLALLAAHKPSLLAQQLLKEFASNSGFDTAGPVIIQDARQIFQQRARHIERTGYPIEGFPELIHGLAAFTGGSITIFNVRFGSGDYAVFADPALSELAGVLKFPKKTTAQEAALKESCKQHESLLAASCLQAV